jgi:hypothetical protein
MSTSSGGEFGTRPYRTLAETIEFPARHVAKTLITRQHTDRALAATIGVPMRSLTADHGRNRTLPLIRTFVRSFHAPLSEALLSGNENVEKP